jgi:hypothetical protein
MKESILKKAYRIIAEDYDFLAHLSLGLRLSVVLALMLLYFTLVILTHLTLHPYLVQSENASTAMSSIYYLVFILAILTILPVLVPRLKKKSSIAMTLIFTFNMFPMALLTILIPGLRKYKTIVIGIAVYISIGLMGLVIMSVGEKEGILSRAPDTTAVVLWAVGLLIIFFSMFIYGYVMEKVSNEKTRIETEINIAQDIQSKLVPPVELSGNGYEVFGKMEPAYQIGGDFFDFIKLSANQFIVAIGDVSGHNIAAGLLMAITKGVFREAIQHTVNPGELAASMNRSITGNSDRRMFVSFKCGVIDLSENVITVVNAGHLPLLHYRNHEKKIYEYNMPGLAFGLSGDAAYSSQKIHFEKGDLLFLITDGMVEASGLTGEEFGFDRLMQRIESLSPGSGLRSIYENLLSELKAFTGAGALKDDATFLGIRIA